MEMLEHDLGNKNLVAQQPAASATMKIGDGFGCGVLEHAAGEENYAKNQDAFPAGNNPFVRSALLESTPPRSSSNAGPTQQMTTTPEPGARLDESGTSYDHLYVAADENEAEVDHTRAMKTPQNIKDSGFGGDKDDTVAHHKSKSYGVDDHDELGPQHHLDLSEQDGASRQSRASTSNSCKNSRHEGLGTSLKTCSSSKNLLNTSTEITTTSVSDGDEEPPKLRLLGNNTPSPANMETECRAANKLHQGRGRAPFHNEGTSSCHEQPVEVGVLAGLLGRNGDHMNVFSELQGPRDVEFQERDHGADAATTVRKMSCDLSTPRSQKSTEKTPCSVLEEVLMATNRMIVDVVVPRDEAGGSTVDPRAGTMDVVESRSTQSFVPGPTSCTSLPPQRPAAAPLGGSWSTNATRPEAGTQEQILLSCDNSTTLSSTSVPMEQDTDIAVDNHGGCEKNIGIISTTASSSTSALAAGGSSATTPAATDRVIVGELMAQPNLTEAVEELLELKITKEDAEEFCEQYGFDPQKITPVLTILPPGALHVIQASSKFEQLLLSAQKKTSLFKIDTSKDELQQLTAHFLHLIRDFVRTNGDEKKFVADCEAARFCFLEEMDWENIAYNLRMKFFYASNLKRKVIMSNWMETSLKTLRSSSHGGATTSTGGPLEALKARRKKMLSDSSSASRKSTRSSLGSRSPPGNADAAASCGGGGSGAKMVNRGRDILEIVEEEDLLLLLCEYRGLTDEAKQALRNAVQPVQAAVLGCYEDYNSELYQDLHARGGSPAAAPKGLGMTRRPQVEDSFEKRSEVVLKLVHDFETGAGAAMSLGPLGGGLGGHQGNTLVLQAEQFFQMHNIDKSARDIFWSSSVEVQQAVLRAGPLVDARNTSAVLVKRVNSLSSQLNLGPLHHSLVENGKNSAVFSNNSARGALGNSITGAGDYPFGNNSLAAGMKGSGSSTFGHLNGLSGAGKGQGGTSMGPFRGGHASPFQQGKSGTGNSSCGNISSSLSGGGGGGGPLSIALSAMFAPAGSPPCSPATMAAPSCGQPSMMGGRNNSLAMLQAEAAQQQTQFLASPNHHQHSLSPTMPMQQQQQKCAFGDNSNSTSASPGQHHLVVPNSSPHSHASGPPRAISNAVSGGAGRSSVYNNQNRHTNFGGHLPGQQQLHQQNHGNVGTGPMNSSSYNNFHQMNNMNNQRNKNNLQNFGNMNNSSATNHLSLERQMWYNSRNTSNCNQLWSPPSSRESSPALGPASGGGLSGGTSNGGSCNGGSLAPGGAALGRTSSYSATPLLPRSHSSLPAYGPYNHQNGGATNNPQFFNMPRSSLQVPYNASSAGGALGRGGNSNAEGAGKPCWETSFEKSLQEWLDSDNKASAGTGSSSAARSHVGQGGATEDEDAHSWVSKLISEM
ncbi:unnamed protein product [Amoebophrya sp. A120]|nr:unnamed protein product [Amoebophrya sp. A120]|eukprot:GSA120T00012323001.1